MPLSRGEVPFKHSLVLHGDDGAVVHVQALFDGGSMVNAMDTLVFSKVSHHLSAHRPSVKQLRLADGTLISSQACWRGIMELDGVRHEGEFEVFDSGGGWEFLFGKPLLRTFNAIHNFATDIVIVKVEDTTSKTIATLQNASGIPPSTAMHDIALAIDVEKQDIKSGGSSDVNPPPRQVIEQAGPTLQIQNDECTIPDTVLMKEAFHKPRNTQGLHLGGQSESTPPVRGVQPSMNTVYDSEADTPSSVPATLDISIVATCTNEAPIFTRHTDPFQLKRVEHILSQVTFGDDLTDQ